jgi:hypothetical protein
MVFDGINIVTNKKVVIKQLKYGKWSVSREFKFDKQRNINFKQIEKLWKYNLVKRYSNGIRLIDI